MSSNTTGITTTSGASAQIDIRQPYTTSNYLIQTESPNYPSRGLSTEDDVVGGIYLFSGNFAPENYAFCEGQTLETSKYPALFSVIGNHFGGNGTTTFALPDLRGRAPIGTGPAQGTGLPEVQLGDEIGRTHETTTSVSRHQHNVSGGGDITPEGAEQLSLNVVMPSLGLTPLIATQGVFPPRGISTNSFLGDISWFAGDYAPKGFAIANGELLSISENQALFALLGTTYGGNGRTTFALPNLQGRVAIQANAQYPIGSQGGFSETTLSTNTLTSHQHTIEAVDAKTTATGLGQPFNLMQPYLSITYQIPLNGSYPPRALQGTNTNENKNRLSMFPTLGGVGMTARNFSARGNATAEGQLLAINGNEALYSILGTTYGGDGRITFGLPNFSGRAVMGTGAIAEGYALGALGGRETHTLTDKELHAHTHSFSIPLLTTIEKEDSSIIKSISASEALINNGTVFSKNNNLTNHGVLKGSGTIASNLINHGTLSPGQSAGGITIQGSLTLVDPSRLSIELGGTDDGDGDRNRTDFDWVEIHGSAVLDGDLDLQMSDGFRPDPQDHFVIVRIRDDATGTFHGLEEGAIVYQDNKDDPTTALRISYRGGDGNDIALYGSSINISESDRSVTSAQANSHQWLYGSDNDSLLNGGSGKDRLFAGDGNNLLIGGDGNDDFIITAPSSSNIILDYTKDDRIILAPSDQAIQLVDQHDFTSLIVDGTHRADIYGDHRMLTPDHFSRLF